MDHERSIQLVAVGEPIQIAYAIALYSIAFVPGAVAALKGHGMWVLAGVFFSPFVWWYALFLLAKPASWWDQNVYENEKRQAAVERYGDATAKPWLVGVAALLLIIPVALGTLIAVLA